MEDRIKRLRPLTSILKQTTQGHGSVDIAPQIDSTVTHYGIVRESPVDILFERNPVTGKRYIKVKVWSKINPALFRFTHIEVKGSQQEMQAKVGVTAGVIAEQLCAIYGNMAAEPSECARHAGKHFAELCKMLENAQKVA
jgi:hypothetical protein